MNFEHQKRLQVLGQKELEDSFAFVETIDQQATIDEVKRDKEKPNPMDRIVCGDVGYGKTEIAVRAAFKAVQDGKQVAVLVPTTLLVQQHFNTFSNRYASFPVKIAALSRFNTANESKLIIAGLKDGSVDVVIGTHRLLSKDIKFADLGLLVVDEEQRFGVEHKEELKKARTNVDVLAMSATPIPRTLEMAITGIREMSNITTPPEERHPVLTYVGAYDDKQVAAAIHRELLRDGQIFFIHNRVENIEAVAQRIRKLVPEVKIGIAHGQLEGDALEDVMLKFVNAETDVLVATTIIEAGLDIPNANTIIINHAHMFGLSDLHQMRGRVGRSNKKAFCYLLSPPLSTLTGEARKRLSAIEEFSELGSGFNVAMRDLDIRGSGNLLGAEQSGFIAEIGFEMYHKILDEAIQELKEEEFMGLFEEEKERDFISFTQVDTDLEVLIPDEYVTSIAERYNLYSTLSTLQTEADLLAFEQGLIDRFGPLPDSVKELANTLRLQWLGKRIGFEKISLKKNVLRGYFISNQQSPYFESEAFGKVLAFVQTKPGACNLKEVKGVLRIAFEGVNDLKQAIYLLNELLG